ncbi:Uma2 family endonuclease [Actinomycetes bacterium KLBMP 9797]
MLTVELPVVAEWTPEVLEGLSSQYRYDVSEGDLIVSAAAMRPWHAEVQWRDLVVEVVSPDSRQGDRIRKPAQYAKGGIHEFWRVEQAEDGEAIVYQYRLTRILGADPIYAETRVVPLSVLEASAA